MANRKHRQESDIVVIGGGPAGVEAAISARNTYPEKSITLIRREKTAMIPCGIPYTLHTLQSVSEDILPDELLHKHTITLLIGEVITKEKNCIILADGRQLTFRKMVLASGSTPVMPKIPGIKTRGVFSLEKDFAALESLRTAAQSAETIVIVGGGYVGVELADELLYGSKSVSLVEALPNLLPTAVDPEFGSYLADNLRDRSARLYLGTSVKAFVGDAELRSILLDSGETIEADMCIVAVGYRPNITLANRFGLRTDPHHGIEVDEYLRTSDPNIYAAGDCAAKRSCFTGEYRQVMLASTATAQGRLAGSNLYAINLVKTFSGSLGTFSTKVGDLALGTTGLIESRAKQMKLEYVVGRAETIDHHPASLPHAKNTIIKLLFARHSHHLVGAQILGGESVGELTNTLSVMIQNKMTDMEIDTLQLGSHPLLTASPLASGIHAATLDAILKWYGAAATEPSFAAERR